MTDLRPRRGPRPTTTPTNPHTQLDQQPDDDDQRRLLAAAAFSLPGVLERPSLISVPGARALWLADGAGGPPEAFLIGSEFAHLHPGDDQSLHAMLPPGLADAIKRRARGSAMWHSLTLYSQLTGARRRGTLRAGR